MGRAPAALVGRIVTAMLYAAVPGNAEPVSALECAFRDAPTGRVQILPNGAVDALDACRAFDTIEAHAARIVARYPEMAGRAEQALRAMTERGLLMSAEQFLAARAPQPTADAPLRAVFIRAADRAANLERLLVSLVEYESRHRARRRYVVLDDSRDPAHARSHATLLAHFADVTGATAVHVGAERWSALTGTIGAVAPEAARRALARDDAQGARFGGGKGYNLAALLGAGARYAMLDDDFVLPLKRLANAERGLDLDPDGELPARFHHETEAALSTGVALEDDPFEQGLGWCGQPLGALWRHGELATSTESLAGFAPSLALHVRPDARVATVTHGHRGDSGTWSSRWMYLLDDDSRHRFHGHEEAAYREHLAGRAVWYGPARARVMPQTQFTPFLVDARVFAPPTTATGRNEDLLFGAAIAAIDPRSVALQSAWTIGHRQDRANRPPVQAAVLPVANQYLVELVRVAGAELRAESPAQRCAGLAAMLRDHAAASPASLRDSIASHVRFARADYARRLDAIRTAATDAPDWWRRDVDALLELQRRAVLEELPAFADWGDLTTVAAAVARLRDTLEDYATVLEAWPALAEHARGHAQEWLEGRG